MSEANHTAVHHPIESFAEFAARERDRLAKQREFAVLELTAAQEKVAGIDRELSAIEAYEAAKTGKPASAPRQQRVRNGSQREALLELIRNSDGLSRGELLESMGLKGDKAGEMSVSNALTALKKQNAVSHEGGKYRVAAAQGETVTLARAAE